PTRQAALQEVVARIREQLEQGVYPQNIGVLCGRHEYMAKMDSALRAAGIAVEAQGSQGQNRIHITQPSVKMLTMHSAKGLDFPHVYLVGLTNDGLPGARRDLPGSDSYSSGLEQQRRLLYTSMIRAGQTLVMTTVAGDEHVLLADLPSGLYRDERIAAE
ncbi:MAG TPA: 3'-5' exonuclease, partial [Ktedonobacterales bacterium]|nr:3'-5' exonuclease [Ktedonobacterales bacterium]